MPTRTKINRIEQEREKPKHQTSFGEIAFDAAVYGGVGYLANAAIGLTLAHYAASKPGSWVFNQNKKLEKGFTQLYEQMLTNPKQVKTWAGRSSSIFFLGMGGWLLLMPMKWMEDNKAAIVERMDHLFDTGPKTQESIEEQRNYLASAPQQDYVSLLGGRTLAYFGAIAGALPLMTNINNLPYVTKDYGLNKQMNGFFEKNFKHQFSRFSQPKILIDLTSKEIILAGVSAAITYGSSKGIAFIRHIVKNSQPEYTINALTAKDQELSYLFDQDITEKPNATINQHSVEHEKLSSPSEQSIEVS